MSFSINTPLNNYFFYKEGPSIGTPLVGGTLEFFVVNSDTNQDTYSNIDDPNNPTVNPNPIVLGADGSTGNSTANSPVIYLQQLPYDIVCKSAEGVAQFTVSNYEGAILDSSILVEVDPRNQIDDGQFNLGIPASNPISGQLIDTAGWTIVRNNNTATDSVAFPPFTLGESDVPQTPYAWLHYNCSVAGTGETTKVIGFTFKNVRSFEGQQCAVSFFAKSALDSAIVIFVQQHFGTGGSPSDDVNTQILNPTLTTAPISYSTVFTVPSCAGKTLGTNGDDIVYFFFQLPLNMTSDVYLTNIQWQLGNAPTSYEYKTYEQIKSDALSTILASEAPNSLDGASQINFYNQGLPCTVAQALATNQYNGGINSNFWVWKRGSTFDCPTNSRVAVADRWQFACEGTMSGSAVITRQNNSAALSSFSNYFMQIVYSAGTGGTSSASHRFYRVGPYNGFPIVYSVLINNPGGSSITFQAQAIQYFGTGGSPSDDVATNIGEAFTIEAGQTNKFNINGTIPSITGKVLGSNGDDALYMALVGPGDQSYTLNFLYDQLNIGTLVVPYVGRDYGTELQACQIFYETNYPNGVAPGTDMGTTYSTPKVTPFAIVTGNLTPFYADDFKTEKIIVPTINFWSVNGTSNKTDFGTAYSTVSQNTITSVHALPTVSYTGVVVGTADTTGIPSGISMAYWAADTGL